SSVEQQDCIESSAPTSRSPLCAVVAHSHQRTGSVFPAGHTAPPRSDPVYSGRYWPAAARSLRLGACPLAFLAPRPPPSHRHLTIGELISIPCDPRSAP